MNGRNSKRWNCNEKLVFVNVAAIMEKPIINAMMFCNDIKEDGKHITMVDPFHHLPSKKFPVTFNQFFVFVSLKGIEAGSVLKVVFESDSGPVDLINSPCPNIPTLKFGIHVYAKLGKIIANKEEILQFHAYVNDFHLKTLELPVVHE